jgi:hypothetical protein
MRQETGEQKIEIHSLLRQPSINFIALYFSALCFMKHTASAAAQHHRQKKKQETRSKLKRGTNGTDHFP